MRRLAVALHAAHFFLMGATVTSAQEPSYDDNALRIESRFGDLQIVRGTEGVVVARAGLWRGPKVAPLFRQPEKALAEAGVFEREYDPAQYILALGIATLGASVGASRVGDISSAIPASLSLVSISLIAYGGLKLERAYRALSKAIWWYNRELRR